MWNEPTKEDLDKLPKLYETENVPLKDKIIHMRFFLGGSEWLIAEYDGNDIFFGYAILNEDYESGEWGYISLLELTQLRIFPGIEVDRDLHWTPKRAEEIVEITTVQNE
jgi:hypothetical protein